MPWVTASLRRGRRTSREDTPSILGLCLTCLALMIAMHGTAGESVGSKTDKDSTIITDAVLLHDARLV